MTYMAMRYAWMSAKSWVFEKTPIKNTSLPPVLDKLTSKQRVNTEVKYHFVFFNQ